MLLCFLGNPGNHLAQPLAEPAPGVQQGAAAACIATTVAAVQATTVAAVQTTGGWTASSEQRCTACTG